MKKRIKQAGVLLLAAVMVMTLFSACGGEEQTGVDPNSTVYVASFQELKADTGNLSLCQQLCNLRQHGLYGCTD